MISIKETDKMSGEIRLAFFLSVCHRNLLQTNQNSKKLKYKNYAKR